jgi:hypothetical protein
MKGLHHNLIHNLRDQFVFSQMFLENILGKLWFTATIPYAVRINDRHRSIPAAAQTGRLGHPDIFLQTVIFDQTAQLFNDLDAPLLDAVHIAADQNMFFDRSMSVGHGLVMGQTMPDAPQKGVEAADFLLDTIDGNPILTVIAGQRLVIDARVLDPFPQKIQRQGIVSQGFGDNHFDPGIPLLVFLDQTLQLLNQTSGEKQIRLKNDDLRAFLDQPFQGSLNVRMSGTFSAKFFIMAGSATAT